MSEDTDARWLALHEADLAGELLGPDERTFLLEHRPRRADLAALASLLASMRASDWTLAPAAEPSAAHDEALLARVLAQPHAPRSAAVVALPRRRARSLGFGVGLAAAAVLLLWLALDEGEPQQHASPAPLARPPVQLHAEPGFVDAEGRELAASTPARGRLDARTPACLHERDEPGNRACASERASIAVDEREATIRAGQVELAWTRPSALVWRVGGMTIEPAPDTRARVEVEAGGWDLVVESGALVLRDAKGELELHAGRRIGEGRATALASRAAALTQPEPTQPEPAEPDSAEPDSAEPDSAEPESAGPDDETSTKGSPSAAALLARAREQRSAGQLDEAAATYERLLRRHPRSKEAASATVSLAQLYLGPLARPADALPLFERARAAGGPLAEEAAYGCARALRALGRSEEREAIEGYLDAHPQGSHADTLRHRLESL